MPEFVSQSCPVAVFLSMTLNQSGSCFAGSEIRIKIVYCWPHKTNQMNGPVTPTARKLGQSGSMHENNL